MSCSTRFDDPRASAITLRRPKPKKTTQPQLTSPPSEIPGSDIHIEVPTNTIMSGNKYTD
jgi:hypothetical protein